MGAMEHTRGRMLRERPPLLPNTVSEDIQGQSDSVNAHLQALRMEA